MSTPEPTIERITPTMAKAWLDPAINHDNRKYRPTHAADLARDMAADRWTYNNDAIAFGVDGRLLNGQHRLSAIVITGKAQKMLVLRGLTDEDFKNMDGNLKRANHERIHIVNDYAQNHVICQAIRTFLYETCSHTGAISTGEIEEEYVKKDTAWAWIGEQAVGMTPKLKKAGIMAAFGIYRFLKPEKAAVFLDGYRTGIGLTEESPILKLRNMALIGGAEHTTYWRVVSVMRAHLQGRTIAQVYPASEDMVGNKNSSKLIEERSASRRKSAETRKKKRNGGSESGAA